MMQRGIAGAILQTPFDQNHKTLGQLYRNALARPLQLLRTQPIVQILAVFYVYLYGLMYLVLSTVASLWRDRYHESVSIGSLHYLALGLGYMVGSQVCGIFANRIYRFLKRRNHDDGRPEFGVVLMFAPSLAVPAGLSWYGWGAHAHCLWIAPDCGIALFAMGAMICFQYTTAYRYEAFTLYAASATGAVYILRGFKAFGFPIFGPRMFETLGYGWSASLLGFWLFFWDSRPLLVYACSGRSFEA